MTPRQERVALLLLVVLAAAVRAPFVAVALDTAVDGDTAIVGLMARHPGQGLTLWGQPYGSPLDAWVAWPFVALLAPHAIALRLPYALLSVALVPLVWALARRIDARAGLPAAFVAALPPAFFLLLSALPPPFYPTILVVLGCVLLIVTGRLSWPRAAGAGLLAGLALWTHLASLAVIVPCTVYLWGTRRSWRTPLAWLVALVLASAPLWLRVGAETRGGVGLGAPIETVRHASSLGPQLPRIVLGLLGEHAPYTEGDPDQRAVAPRTVAVALGVAWLGLLGLALVRLRSRPAAVLLLACVGLTVLLFPLSLRSGANTLRFLSPLWIPLLAVSLGAAADAAGRRGAWAAALVVALLNVPAGLGLLQAWRTPGPWQPLVPECAPIAAALEGAGIRHAYASYNTAWCLTWTSDERVIASQPWNERFPGHPLPLLPRVRASADAAWVLVGGADFDLPPARVLESKLRDHCDVSRVGPATILHSCRAPFAGARHVLVPTSGALEVAVEPPAVVAGLTVRGRLPPVFGLEVSEDGQVFERVLRRRPDRQRLDPMWVNGHPQLVWQDDVASVPLSNRHVRVVRLVPAGPGPWRLDEVVLH